MPSLKATGMQTIINGFLRHKINLQKDLTWQTAFEKIRDDPQPDSLVISCIDSRILSSRILQSEPGDALLSRNPGNLVPDYSRLDPRTPRDAEAALELAVVHNHINTIVICGHSDCKAMNLVYENRTSQAKPCLENDGVLKTWLMSNSPSTISKFLKLEAENFKKPVQIKIAEGQVFEAYIDPDNVFAPNDKFSQLNALVQLESLKNFPFLNKLLLSKRINVFAMWFNIYNGDVYVFSYEDKRFVKLDETTGDRLHKSLEEC